MIEDFLRANTILSRPDFVPQIALHLATSITPIWTATEDWLEISGLEPPFWAFAWPGSLALARHILDHPACVADKRILDFGAGCGLAAIASAMAGAAHVDAAELDAMAIAAIKLNAEENHVSITTLQGDLVGSEGRWDIIMCGDVCYAAPMAAHILPWLRRLAVTAEVWLADPGRAYAPRDGLIRFADMIVPTTLELEDRTERQVVLARLLPA
jgi:predicted nicotinamide N-methyase